VQNLKGYSLCAGALVLYSKYMEQILSNPFIILIILLWTIPFKAVALWRAARREEKKWFIALLVLNTLAVLEIIYIFIFAKKRKGNEQNDDSKKV